MSIKQRIKIKESSINLEEDKVDSLASANTNDIKELSTQVIKLRKLLKDYTPEDYLLLTGDPAIIGIACSIVSETTNGKFNLLKWDRQEKMYYPLKINLHEKGEVNVN